MSETGRKQGKFVKGVSGNPNGRKPKAQSIRDEIEKHRDEIINSLISQCREGSTAACTTLLSRIAPSLKPVGEKVTIQLDSNAPLADQAKAVLSAAGNGDLTTDTATALINSLAGVAKIIETTELLERIENLENAQK
ncbi:hypothetical protein JX580_04480 [Thiomicrospira microaerophila]|uniref:DUF5681 domain-containing protein n=1 Tax=Thiomicrospira microaerophila TaxID=406020 RepID=UPI00200F8FD0|nr:DUF5681 domain-containing protein [Thiomicrospira microaerophila]UQB43144.1 hypothetical protein JX580_04480 [Thiomicrospira microaerophila]